MDVVFPQGAKLPTKKISKTYETSVDGQEYVTLEILQGTRFITKKLGQVRLQTLGEKVGIEKFDLSMEITSDEIVMRKIKQKTLHLKNKYE
uniref:Uncharacterized protein n=1 Tax=Panagrolaimus davidi TaxID=227884 RepID=A0A914QNL4_9BILA